MHELKREIKEKQSEEESSGGHSRHVSSSLNEADDEVDIINVNIVSTLFTYLLVG